MRPLGLAENDGQWLFPVSHGTNPGAEGVPGKTQGHGNVLFRADNGTNSRIVLKISPQQLTALSAFKHNDG